MKRIAVIPARGGSKRIAHKNIRQFCGAPIISYAIEAALKSWLFDEIIVSTDDEKIAEVARSYGATTPFMRPAELSGDHAPIVPVVAHAIDSIGGCDEACLIYATAPFVKSEDLISAANILGENDFILSITAFEYPIFRALKIDNNNAVSSIWKEYEQTRSQDIESAYHDAGQFCYGKAKSFLESRSIFNGKTVGVVIDKKRVQDIDTIEDWERAEAMFIALKEGR